MHSRITGMLFAVGFLKIEAIFWIWSSLINISMQARFLVLGLIVCSGPSVVSQSTLHSHSEYQKSPQVGANPYETNSTLYEGIGGTFPPAHVHESSGETPVADSVVDVPLSRGFLDNTLDDGLGSLWRSTRTLRDRSILFSQTHRSPFEDKSNVSATLFADVLWERTFLFNILNPAILAPLLDENVLKELKKFSFAQEQVGFLLHGCHAYKKVAFSVDLPISVMLTHAWAPLSARQKLSENNSDASASETPIFTPDQVSELKALIEEIGWAKGLGDLKLGVKVFDSFLADRLLWTVGGELVIPLQSAAPAKKNLSFDPVADNFNPALFDLQLDEIERFKYVKNFLLTLKALGTTPCIGQKSYGLGVNGGFKVEVHPTCTVYAAAQLYYQTPVKEYRIVHRYLDASETVLAVEPGEFLVESHRGVILRGTTGFEQKLTKNISFGLGGDVFFQNKETLYSEIFTSSEKSRSIKDAAEMEQVTQAIAFGHLTKKLGMFGGNAQLSLCGSGTLGSSGIGKLWNIGLCLASTF